MKAKTRRAPVALPETLHPEQRIAMPLVELLTGRKKTHLYDEEKAGRFPAGERDGTRCTRWRVGDVLAWLASPPVRPASAHTTPASIPGKPRRAPPAKPIKRAPTRRKSSSGMEAATAEAV